MARRALGPALLAVTSAVARELAASTEPIRVGVSGGADSMALALGVAHAVRTQGLQADALVVDHGLQAGSAEVASTVVATLTGLGLPAASVRVEVAGAGGIEASAREARYRALWTTPGTGGRLPREVWLGHTLDDQAETVLLGLLRGSGTRTLAGMAPRRPETPDPAVPTRGSREVVRPLLGLRRSVTRQACAEAGVAVWDDPTNDDPRQPRASVRHRVLPALADVLGDRVVLGLARSADLARADADLLDALAAEAANAVVTGDRIDAAALAAEPAALASRIVHGWLTERGGVDVARVHVDAVLALVRSWRGQGPVQVPGGIEVGRAGGWLIARPTPPPPGENGRIGEGPAGDRLCR